MLVVTEPVRKQGRIRKWRKLIFLCLPPFVKQPNSLTLVLKGNMVKGRKEKREGRKRKYSWKVVNKQPGGEWWLTVALGEEILQNPPEKGLSEHRPGGWAPGSQQVQDETFGCVWFGHHCFLQCWISVKSNASRMELVRCHTGNSAPRCKSASQLKKNYWCNWNPMSNWKWKPPFCGRWKRKHTPKWFFSPGNKDGLI